MPSLPFDHATRFARRRSLPSSAIYDKLTPITRRFAPRRVRLRTEAMWASSFVFLHVSSMTSNKNVGLIVRAFQRIRENFSNAKLVLKGNDELYESLTILRNEIEGFEELVESRGEKGGRDGRNGRGGKM